jgi:hypothetical protein
LTLQNTDALAYNIAAKSSRGVKPSGSLSFCVKKLKCNKASGIPEVRGQLKNSEPSKIITALKKFADFSAILELKEILEGV